MDPEASSASAEYAEALIALEPAVTPRREPTLRPDRHPALDWAACGGLWLTGTRTRPALAPGWISACARGAEAALRALAPEPLPATLDGAALLCERAAIAGFERRGRTSAGGSCHLVPAADAWLAVQLARDEDIALMPAWLECEPARDPLTAIAEAVRERAAGPLVARARLLGLPIAEVGAQAGAAGCRTTRCGERQARSDDARPLVVDLSSLWAGPLCTHLLALGGAQVIKVESPQRPDGARRGPRAFFDLLNAGKRCVALDFTTSRGRDTLRALIERADIVVEASRPRALEQLGVYAEAQVAARPGTTWLAISGYGRSEPQRNWVAFGDDAAAAAGLPLQTGGDDAPVFCGDAIADPLTGLHAAVAALASFWRGGGELLDLSLCGVAAQVMRWRPSRDPVGEARVDALRAGGFAVAVGEARQTVEPPTARLAANVAHAMGADTDAVLRELGIPC